MDEIFQFKMQTDYNLRKNSTLRVPCFNKIYKGKESVS